MEHQRVVLDLVKAASLKEQSDVTLKLFALYESFFKALHDSFFFICELVWIIPIYSREDRVGEFIFHTIDGNGVRFPIDLVQQFSIFELERWIVVNKLGFDLELQDCHCFLYLYVQIVFLGA